LTSFVGREQELAMLGRLLGVARLVTLTGAGGTRKTRLAVEFADGVWLADLAGLSDPNLVGGADDGGAGGCTRSAMCR
jgi:predicted ATPase